MKVVRPNIGARAITALRAEVKARHPKAKAKVTVIKRHGWCPMPTLLDVWTATCEITAPGYAPKRGTLWANRDGTWRFR